jgi:hypothetical protein
MKKFRFLAVALCLAAASGRLAAQTYRSYQDEVNDIRTRGGLRFGSLWVFPSLRFTNLGYDSNVYYQPKEDVSVADWTGTLALEAKGCWLLGSSVILSFTERPEYIYYLNEGELRTPTNSFSPGVRILLLNRLSLFGDYHVLRQFRRSISEFGEPVKDTQEGWNARVFFETPRGTALGFSGSLDDFRYDNPSLSDPENDYARALDRRERAAAFEAYYRVFSRSHLFARVGGMDYAFLDPTSTWRNAHSWEAMGGIQLPLSGRAVGTLALGYKKFIPEIEGRTEFSGLIADTDLAFRAGRVALSLALTRDNYFSYIEAAYYYVENRFRGGLAYYLLPFLRLEGSCQIGEWEYPEPHVVWFQGVPYLVTDRRDKNRIISAGLAVRISGRAGLSVSYNFYRRTSTAPGFDIDRNFIGAALTYDF